MEQAIKNIPKRDIFYCEATGFWKGAGNDSFLMEESSEALRAVGS